MNHVKCQASFRYWLSDRYLKLSNRKSADPRVLYAWLIPASSNDLIHTNRVMHCHLLKHTRNNYREFLKTFLIVNENCKQRKQYNEDNLWYNHNTRKIKSEAHRLFCCNLHVPLWAFKIHYRWRHSCLGKHLAP